MTDTPAPDVVVTEAEAAVVQAVITAYCHASRTPPPIATNICTKQPVKDAIVAARLSTESAIQARIEELEAALRLIADHDRVGADSGYTALQNIARAALSSAIGDEFSGWVEVVEEGK